jgi:hypothetical protein
MRRLLSKPPEGIKYEIIGPLARATINTTTDYEPFAFVPYRPYYCPVCGKDAGAEGHIPTILALEFTNGEKHNFVTWSHQECIDECIETDEPDADLE